MTDSFDLDRIGGHRGLSALVDEVLGAGEHALDLYRAGAARRAEKKLDRSPVTEADRAVERRLRAFLERRYPAAAFLGEETGSASGSGSGSGAGAGAGAGPGSAARRVGKACRSRGAPERRNEKDAGRPGGPRRRRGPRPAAARRAAR
ncbi:MAG: hypothetical protein KC543_15845, partial [Myxococcales bacterium]|nr:hypothetical protein [Myxococcales bacterium]